MRVYVINLDESPDRLAHMSSSLTRAELEFERIPAVSRKRLSSSERLAFMAGRDDCRLSAGEIGCFLSHYAVWRRIIEGPDDWALVLEDDVLISPGLGAFLLEFPEETPKAIIKIETMRNSVEVGPPALVVAGVEICELRSAHPGTAGYLIHRDTAAIMLEVTAQLGAPIDCVFSPGYYGLPGLRMMQAVPALAVQSMKSDGRFQSLIDRPGAKKRRTRGAVERWYRLIERGVEDAFKTAWHLVIGKRVLRIPFADEGPLGRSFAAPKRH